MVLCCRVVNGAVLKLIWSVGLFCRVGKLSRSEADLVSGFVLQGGKWSRSEADLVSGFVLQGW